jgi:hypothetical protein
VGHASGRFKWDSISQFEHKGDKAVLLMLSFSIGGDLGLCKAAIGHGAHVALSHMQNILILLGFTAHIKFSYPSCQEIPLVALLRTL